MQVRAYDDTVDGGGRLLLFGVCDGISNAFNAMRNFLAVAVDEPNGKHNATFFVEIVTVDDADELIHDFSFLLSYRDVQVRGPFSHRRNS